MSALPETLETRLLDILRDRTSDRSAAIEAMCREHPAHADAIRALASSKAAARAPASPPAGGAARAAAVTPAASPPVAVATASVGAVAGEAKPLQSC